MALQNDDFLRALKRQPVSRRPIWLMRQAGRYLPEYRQVRAQAGDFLTLCKTPKLACEVTLQPLRRFDLDAAILFSDILTIPDAMGLGLYFAEGEGPKFRRTVRSMAEFSAFKKPDMHQDLGYVFEAVDHIKTGLEDRVPLIGFSGSPWTLAAYMVQGQGSRDFSHLKQWLYSKPDELEQFLLALAHIVAEYVIEQIKAGVDAVQLFDTWGGLLAPHHYQRFSLAPMQVVVEAVRAVSEVPIILFTKGGGAYLSAMADTGADALGCDWMVSLVQAFSEVGDRVALQGNLDPLALLGDAEPLRQEVQRILQAAQHYPGFIFNLGHGITPQANPDRVSQLVDWVHNLPQE